jgi:hypothetical protein
MASDEVNASQIPGKRSMESIRPSEKKRVHQRGEEEEVALVSKCESRICKTPLHRFPYSPLIPPLAPGITDEPSLVFVDDDDDDDEGGPLASTRVSLVFPSHPIALIAPTLPRG